MGKGRKKLNYKQQQEKMLAGLPGCAGDFVRLVARKMGYRRKVRGEVMAELAGHFEDAIKECTTAKEREEKARELIEEFGDAKLLAVLCRRAKKRCRSLRQKILIRSLQVLGVVLLFVVVRGASLVIGTAEIKVDYLAWLNELVRESDDESLNAMPYYEKAVKLSDNKLAESVGDYLDWPGEMTEEEHAAVEEILAANKEAIDLAVEGSGKPYCWTKYRGEGMANGPADMSWQVMGNLMASLSGYKRLARLLAARINWRAYNGDVEGAAEDTLALCRFARHLEGKGLLVEQLMGIGIVALGYGRVLALLDEVDVPAESLLQIQQELEKDEKVVNLEAEKTFWYDMIQRSFTDDGAGNGRALAEGLPLVISDAKDMVRGFLLFDYPDRRETQERIETYFRLAQEYIDRTPWDVHVRGGEDQLEDAKRKCLLLDIAAPAYLRVAEIAARLKTHRAGVVTVLALKRYQKEKGYYPEELCELVSGGYLKELPEDPYSGKALVYRKEGDDFVLYSIWNNFQDDGGVMGTGRDGEPRMWGEGGDAVFWPVGK